MVLDIQPRTLDCALASHLLEQMLPCPRQRLMDWDLAEEYAAKMKDGVWKSYTADMVVVSGPLVATAGRQGMMENGQHRCMAVMLSHVPIKVLLWQFADSLHPEWK
jgi:hypothetical protein